MKKEKFTKAVKIQQELGSLKNNLSEVLKYKSFTVNHKQHMIALTSKSEDKSIRFVSGGTAIDSKMMVEIAESIEKKIVKRIKKLEKAFKKL